MNNAIATLMESMNNEDDCLLDFSPDPAINLDLISESPYLSPLTSTYS